jgi:hypothetical protein
MEPEGSLQQSQVPANSPYPEKSRSSPYPNIPLPELGYLIRHDYTRYSSWAEIDCSGQTYFVSIQ